MALRLTWPAAWVSHDRQDIGGELRRLRLTGMRSTAPVGRASYPSPTSLTAARTAVGVLYHARPYSFIPAKAALRCHNARAARSSNAAADGVVGRHL
jgi:hypothetical protein